MSGMEEQFINAHHLDQTVAHHLLIGSMMWGPMFLNKVRCLYKDKVLGGMCGVSYKKDELRGVSYKKDELRNM